MTSINSTEKDSVAATPDHFKDCILACKLSIKCIQTSRKEKFHKQPVITLFRNDFSVRYMFCTIFVSLSAAKILEKHVRSSSYLLLVFFKKTHIHMENLLNSYFYYSFFISNFLNRYF